ncbi:MAG: 50S ribosomal protein L29 [Planctomycetes bacterium]|nr:50S ribosomal protein L29 [Planctomycetota bacterium]
MKKAITEIRGMDTAELRARLNDLRREQFGLKFRGSPEQVKQTAKRTAIRRTIARIVMVLADREAAAVPAAATPAVGKPAAGGPAARKSPASGGPAPAGATPGKSARSAKSGAK